MDIILDALVNSWENWDNIEEEASFIAHDLDLSPELENGVSRELKALLTAWMDNEDNVRINFQMAKINDIELKDWVRTKVKSIKI